MPRSNKTSLEVLTVLNRRLNYRDRDWESILPLQSSSTHLCFVALLPHCTEYFEVPGYFSLNEFNPIWQEKRKRHQRKRREGDGLVFRDCFRISDRIGRLFLCLVGSFLSFPFPFVTWFDLLSIRFFVPKRFLVSKPAALQSLIAFASVHMPLSAVWRVFLIFHVFLRVESGTRKH